jgi:hypothetical protein
MEIAPASVSAVRLDETGGTILYVNRVEADIQR